MTTQHAKTSDLKNQLAMLNKQRDILLAEIKLERESGLSENSLKDEISRAELSLDKLNKKLDKAKAQVKQRKTEIKQWKDNFARLDKIDKSQELIQLQDEIDWRAKDIADKEAEIANLYVSKNEQTGTLENLNIKLTIVEQGYHKQDINQDPRLLALTEELDEIKTVIANSAAR